MPMESMKTRKRLTERVTARIDEEMKCRIQRVSSNVGVDESDLIRIGINYFLPKLEANQIDEVLCSSEDEARGESEDREEQSA